MYVHIYMYMRMGIHVCVQSAYVHGVCVHSGFTGEIQPQDKCSQYETCNDCISADPDCQWCPYQPVRTCIVLYTCIRTYMYVHMHLLIIYLYTCACMHSVNGSFAMTTC